MRAKKIVFIFILSFFVIIFLINTVSSEDEFPSRISMGKEIVSENEKLHNDPSLTAQLKVKDAVIKVNGWDVEGAVLVHKDKYYLPFQAIKSLQRLWLDYTPLLDEVIINMEEKSFQLSVITANDLFPVSPFHAIEKRMKADHVLISEEEVYLPLSFIRTHLQYETKIEEKENLLISIDYRPVQLPLDVPLIHQMADPMLYNGCEVTSLAMLLRYHGIEVTKNELAEEIPHVPLTYNDGLKGNPNKGFVGDMEKGPGLGVFHAPMFDLAKNYAGNGAKDITGSEADTMYDYIDQGMPVWIITTANFNPVSDFQTWETPSGRVEVTFSVHSVVVTGYEKDFVYINDPYGGKNKKVNRTSFEQAWEQMGRQAIVITR